MNRLDTAYSLYWTDQIHQQAVSPRVFNREIVARIAVIALVCFELCRMTAQLALAGFKLPFTVLKIIIPLKKLGSDLEIGQIGRHLQHARRSFMAVCLDAPRLFLRPERVLALYRQRGLLAPLPQPSVWRRMAQRVNRQTVGMTAISLVALGALVVGWKKCSSASEQPVAPKESLPKEDLWKASDYVLSALGILWVGHFYSKSIKKLIKA